MVKFLIVAIAILSAVIVVALLLVMTPMEPLNTVDDVFGFENSGEKSPGEVSAPAAIHRYVTRDGEPLAYRVYPSSSSRILLFVHGSSYHSAAYHGLAKSISDAGLATVYMPNLRGHYLSGVRRGDIDHMGQFEDDLADLIAHARSEGDSGEIIVGGHSSGGGLAIRFAGGEHSALASGYWLLAPVIPGAPSVRDGDAGGWAVLNNGRLAGLLMLNAFGITGLNGLPVIQFNKPVVFRDGTETLSYSFRLNQSYHPRYNYEQDIQAMGDRVEVFVGEHDEAVDPETLKIVFTDAGSKANIHVFANVNHFGIFDSPAARQSIVDALR
ncbi:MAG: alpha/beta fold hydrolase [Gammaproteobacteria bacterium]|nr:alpha/beta fold hydrolase [Gammaproteobacteria bacterium]